MTYDELIDHFGSQAEAARSLGLKQPSISEWKKRGIPPLRQLDIQRRTRGRLRADTTALDTDRACA
jgi:DNA-binding transcriptional regulator YdaS (Cro superfamily)